MKQLIPLLALILLVASLTGCKEEVPKCSDDDTIALVKNIVAEQIGGSDEATRSEVKGQLAVEYARASGFDEEYECEAKLIAGGTYQLPLTYESQIDKGGGSTSSR